MTSAARDVWGPVEPSLRHRNFDKFEIKGFYGLRRKKENKERKIKQKSRQTNKQTKKIPVGIGSGLCHRHCCVIPTYACFFLFFFPFEHSMHDFNMFASRTIEMFRMPLIISIYFCSLYISNSMRFLIKLYQQTGCANEIKVSYWIYHYWQFSRILSRCDRLSPLQKSCSTYQYGVKSR